MKINTGIVMRFANKDICIAAANVLEGYETTFFSEDKVILIENSDKTIDEISELIQKSLDIKPKQFRIREI